MKFTDLLVCRERRFSLGVEEESAQYYLSIPVSNRLVDYEEYYRIDRAAFERYQADPERASSFVNRCRRREADELLIIAPGMDRGAAV